jgi:hypothetical protein
MSVSVVPPQGPGAIDELVGFLICVARRSNRAWIAVPLLVALIHLAIPPRRLGAQQTAAAFALVGRIEHPSVVEASGFRQKTGLYRLRLEKPTGFKPLVKVCDVPAIDTVTGADISADGRRVARCSYREVVVSELGDTGLTALAGEPVRRISFQASGVEGGAWDGTALGRKRCAAFCANSWPSTFLANMPRSIGLANRSGATRN